MNKLERAAKAGAFCKMKHFIHSTKHSTEHSRLRARWVCR
jgi:hypothetical protein